MLSIGLTGHGYIFPTFTDCHSTSLISRPSGALLEFYAFNKIQFGMHQNTLSSLIVSNLTFSHQNEHVGAHDSLQDPIKSCSEIEIWSNLFKENLIISGQLSRWLLEWPASYCIWVCRARNGMAWRLIRKSSSEHVWRILAYALAKLDQKSSTGPNPNQIIFISAYYAVLYGWFGLRANQCKSVVQPNNFPWSMLHGVESSCGSHGNRPISQFSRLKMKPS